VYNGGEGEATGTFAAGESGLGGTRAVTVRLRAGELRRVRTGWAEAGSKVRVSVQGGEGVRFDNLAWVMP
jgi:hypothetical protein